MSSAIALPIFDCSICLDPIDPSNATQCPNSHSVHEKCAQLWATRFNTTVPCPTCRKDLVGIVGSKPPDEPERLNSFYRGFTPTAITSILFGAALGGYSTKTMAGMALGVTMSATIVALAAIGIGLANPHGNSSDEGDTLY